MKFMIVITFALLSANIWAETDKDHLCRQLKIRSEIVKRYGIDWRGHVSRYTNYLDNRRGTDVFEAIEGYAQCGNQKMVDLEQSIEFSGASNLLYFSSAKQLRKIFNFYQNEYPAMLNYVSSYGKLAPDEVQVLKQFIHVLPIFVTALKNVGEKLGAFGTGVELVQPKGSIVQIGSNQKIIIDYRSSELGEVWFVYDNGVKKELINRVMVNNQRDIKKTLKLYDKEYFKLTTDIAAAMYGAVTDILIPYSPIILPLGAVAIIPVSIVEGGIYMFSRKNQTIVARALFAGDDKYVGKRKFSKMFKFVNDAQFEPYTPLNER